MTNKIICPKWPEVGHAQLQWLKKKNQNPNKHKPPKQTKTTKQTKNPKDPKPRQYTVQDYVYAGLEKKSVFLMHL